MGNMYQVVVHGFKGEKMTVDLCNTEEQMKRLTVQQLKKKIMEKLPVSAGEEALWMIYIDKMLDGDSTLLSEYGIHHKSIIQMALKVPVPKETRSPDTTTVRGERFTETSARVGKIYQVVVNGCMGQKLTVDLCNTEEQMKSMTVLQLKEKILEKLPGNAGEDALRMIYTDKMLDGDSTLLSEYGIHHMSIIQMALKVPFPKETTSPDTTTVRGERFTETSARVGKIYQVVVKGYMGKKMTVDLCNTEEQMKSMTVLQLKEKILEKLPVSAGEDELRLIFTDKMLDGDSTLLSEYGIQNQSIIQMVLRSPGGLAA